MSLADEPGGALAAPGIPHGRDDEDVSVGRELELGVDVDLERPQERLVDHLREAVTGSSAVLRFATHPESLEGIGLPLAAALMLRLLAPRVASLLLLSSIAAPTALAQVAIEVVTVGAPGAPGYAGPSNPSAAVPHVFEIGRYEVTNLQYAALLDAVAAVSDPNELWSPSMQSNSLGGIERTGIAGNWDYTAKTGMENMPVNYVSFWDALRFANWMHNGQPQGGQDATTTEDGAYTITAPGVADNDVPRNPDALFAVPTRDEWLKAAYYEDSPSTWYLSPAQSQTSLVGGAPVDDDGNTGNCGGTSVFYDVGSYTLSDSPWGTFDQGGSVSEWTEEIRGGGSARAYLGGDNISSCSSNAPSSVPFVVPTQQRVNLGFRIVVPAAPSVPLLSPVAFGGLALLLSAAGATRLRRPRR